MVLSGARGCLVAGKGKVQQPAGAVEGEQSIIRMEVCGLGGVMLPAKKEGCLFIAK